MELSEQEKNRLVELEYCYKRYFDMNLAPVMEQVQKELSAKQAEELREYGTSARGILATALPTPSGDPYDIIKHTGKWNSLKAEDYVELCRERIGQSEKIGHDLEVLAGSWREEAIGMIGRERYDSMSEKMGMDLAYAYTCYRMESQMIGRMVQERMPKSTLEYVLRAATKNSLLGLTGCSEGSELESELQEKGEQAYSPSPLEYRVGQAAGFGIDTLMTGGFSSWGNLARLFGVELLVNEVTNTFETGKGKESTVEQLVSREVFGADERLLQETQRQARQIVAEEQPYIRNLDDKVGGRMKLLPEDTVALLKGTGWNPSLLDKAYGQTVGSDDMKEGRIPMVIRPGKEAEYLESLQDKTKNQQTEDTDRTENREDTGKGQPKPIAEEWAVPETANGNTGAAFPGWEKLLNDIGLSDAGSVGKNLGYVIAMLPEMVGGMFSGKSKSLQLSDNLLPIASILFGLFVRNPLLKMMLIGLGGMNLINKAGHEALQAEEHGKGRSVQQYRVYPDEALDGRIKQPEVKGNYLFATMDRVPCSIRLPDATVAAYQEGALPLNTLANAVLAKSDEIQALAQKNYAATEGRDTPHARGIS